mmetsp:Transcript_45134/g.125178  ORF Transcript_45134/g.125178 Transcript_45134/m.125178 type:complete len:627 (+) Transcript_45134:89-1969(+)|eukprot:CAMPEP_0117575992 /NCGR_PEP_ID=MMETSP0784-20121206/62538_1 /TAXON_ID=39447 /ORGANISM="" /LENGTH=626 /DNA_ID=CAMNT_0005375171 /DNA_START=40 /DNA_END=1920 /DNA_ORIENTATION=-
MDAAGGASSFESGRGFAFDGNNEDLLVNCRKNDLIELFQVTLGEALAKQKNDIKHLLGEALGTCLQSTVSLETGVVARSTTHLSKRSSAEAESVLHRSTNPSNIHARTLACDSVPTVPQPGALSDDVRSMRRAFTLEGEVKLPPAKVTQAVTDPCHRSPDRVGTDMGEHVELSLRAYQPLDDFSEEDDSASDDDRCRWFGSSGRLTLKCETFVGAIVVLNIVSLGFETNDRAVRSSGATIPFDYDVVNACFCAFFTLELALRIVCLGRGFFTAHDRVWNMCDLVAVGMQLLDELCSRFFVSPQQLSESAIARTLRVLRILRMSRLTRVLRLNADLRSMTSSIYGSLKSLGSAVLLLISLIYAFSVFFCTLATEAMKDGVESPETLDSWYGSLGRTFLTLFESILGGVSWDEPLRPIIQDVGPWVSAVYCVYVLFCAFSVMNVVTGLFVQQAMRMAQEENDIYMAESIKNIFGMSTSRSITCEDFRKKVERDDMQEYLKAISVDPSEGDHIFQLLDFDGSGEIDEDEAVDGLFRLRGNATALELSMLRRDIARAQAHFSEQQDKIWKLLTEIKDKSSLSTTAQHGQQHPPVAEYNDADEVPIPKQRAKLSLRTSIMMRARTKSRRVL